MGHRSTQVRMDLANGISVSVITDGYGSEAGLFEALVWWPNGRGVTDLIPGGDGLGVYGWLNPAMLGDLITEASKLA